MDILILGPAYPYRGGIAAGIDAMAKKFIEQGDRVRVFTFTLQYPSFLFPGETQFLTAQEQAERNDNTSYITREVSSVNPFNWVRVGLRLRKLKPDLVVLRYWHPYFAPCFGVISFLARSNGHTRVVALLDNVVAHESRRFDSLLTRFFVANTEGFVYMSEAVKRDLDRFTRSKPALFSPHPIFENFGTRQPRTTSAQLLGLDLSQRYLLFFGIVRQYKGLDLLIDAWAQLCQEGKTKGMKLIVAGEYYNDKEPYFEQIERLGLKNEVLMHDRFIGDSEVKHYFSVCDLLILPYREATQSGVTQIAYQFEVPLVVTRVGGLPEIAANGRVGVVAEPQPHAIAAAIEEALQPDVYLKLKENMKQEKEKYSWDKMCVTLKRLLKR